MKCDPKQNAWTIDRSKNSQSTIKNESTTQSFKCGYES